MSTAPDPYATTPGTPVAADRPGEAGVTQAAPVGLLPRVGAELLGTFALVLTILGTALYLQLTAVGLLGVALATALVLAGLIAAFGNVSGGHFNPAVSLGAALAGRISFVDMVMYWLAQVAGAVIAAFVLVGAIPKGLASALLGNPDAGTKEFFATVANGWGDHSPLFAQTEAYTVSAGLADITFDLRTALILEVVATAVFVAVILGVTGRKAAPATAPFAIGGTLGAMILVTGLVTNAGLNPARSTAAALFAGGDAVGQLWLFWVAPLLGAAIVGLVVLAFTPAPVEAYDPEGYDPLLDEEQDEDDELAAAPLVVEVDEDDEAVALPASLAEPAEDDAVDAEDAPADGEDER